MCGRPWEQSVRASRIQPASSFAGGVCRSVRLRCIYTVRAFRTRWKPTCHRRAPPNDWWLAASSAWLNTSGPCADRSVSNDQVHLSTAAPVAGANRAQMCVQLSTGQRASGHHWSAVVSTLWSTLEHSNSRFESIRFVMRIDSNRFVL